MDDRLSSLPPFPGSGRPEWPAARRGFSRLLSGAGAGFWGGTFGFLGVAGGPAVGPDGTALDAAAALALLAGTGGVALGGWAGFRLG